MQTALDVFTVAAFAGVLSSIIIGIAITASNQSDVFKSRLLSGWVHGLFIVGLGGLLIFPVFGTLNTGGMDTQAICCTYIVDVLVVLAIICLAGYYIFYFRNKSWRVANVESMLPPQSTNLL